MKIGTLTLLQGNNYGGILQVYALQNVIKKLGHENEVIKYNRNNMKDVLEWQKNKIINFFKLKKDKQAYTNKEFINMVINEMTFKNKEVDRKFKDFRKKIKFSEDVNKNIISDLNDRYDMFVSGSDQVWNCGRVNMDKTYLLDFIKDKNRKGSYAASFGITQLPEKYLDQYKSLLSEYKYLSVREETGAKIINNLLNREAKVVLDPTLLLNNYEWNSILDNNKTSSRKIIVYQLGYSEQLMQFARKLSKNTGLDIVVLNKVKAKSIPEYCREDVGPIEWLEEFRDAEYVVTNSFHGVAFSINFNKQFFVEVSTERVRGAIGSRINNILNMFNLNDRLIFDDSNLMENKKIEYSDINQKLEVLRNESIEYLENMLNN